MRGHASAAGSGPGQGWPADLKAHLAYLSGGCIYTLGPQPGSTVRGNYCALDEAPVVGCFYHDNGSRGFVTSDNVADASGRDSNAPPPPCHSRSALGIRATALYMPHFSAGLARRSALRLPARLLRRSRGRHRGERALVPRRGRAAQRLRR
jgi:hypothetical protein